MDTPTLEKMGIANAGEISRYTLRQKSARQDTLKIFYERKPGSLLPISRVYEFGRGLKVSVADSGEPRMDDTYEISPVLLEAVAELDRLLADKGAGGPAKRDVLAEIAELRERVATTGTGDATDLANRLDRLRDHVQRL